MVINKIIILPTQVGLITLLLFGIDILGIDKGLFESISGVTLDST
jgi:hypothetical protein